MCKVLRLLLEHRSKSAPIGIDVNAADRNGANALMALCEKYEHDCIIDIVRLLVVHGTDINATNRDMGWNALVILCYHYKGKNLYDIVHYLLRSGPPQLKVNVEENKGANALIAACASYRHESLIDLVRLLISYNIDINWTNPADLKSNALITLCGSGYSKANLIQIIQQLLDNQIDINAKTLDGTNCLLALTETQHGNRNFIDIVQLLIQKGIDINHRNSENVNVFHLLCKLCKINNLLDILRRVFFVSKDRIDLSVRENNKKTPMDYLQARKTERKHEVIQFLMQSKL